MARGSLIRRALRSTATVAVLAVCLPAGAWAQDDDDDEDGAKPSITSGPTIAGPGPPREGATLTASATWTSVAPATESWTWVRCRKNASACRPIDGATSREYGVAAADVGLVLRARVTVTNPEGSAQKRSAPTDVVRAAAPVDPNPTPIPNPPPTPRPTTTSPWMVDQPPAPGEILAGAGGGGAAAAPLMLDPFPVVRLRGRLTPTGARITLFTVRATHGTLISVRCRGESCPVRRFARRASRTRVKPLERHLRAGTRLLVKVTKAGYIGKWTRIVIRRGAVPRRSDRCLYPGAGDPVRCAAR